MAVQGAFFNDRRDPSSIDYTAPLVKFCLENSIPPPPLGPNAAKSGALPRRGRMGRDYEVPCPFLDIELNSHSHYHVYVCP